MARRRFIDWNGSGKLDTQDLITGVALDTVEKKKPPEEQSTQPVPNATTGYLGCMLPAICFLAVGFVTIAGITFFL